jgi:DNA-binding NtrC family response regulator
LLLLCEPGAEPEGLARFVHQSGTRTGQPLLVLGARGVSTEQVALLLAGSADAGPGLLQQARGGTLFIADVDDLPDAGQRVLAGAIAAGAEVRIIASAQAGAQQRMQASGVGQELYALLAALLVRVPPLREALEDIPGLLRHTAEQLAEAERLRLRRFSVAAQNRLRNYPWPDNLRELRSLVRRVLQRTGPEEISLDEVERELNVQQGGEVSLVQQDLLALPLREAREHFERAYLTQQLQLCGGKVGALAKRVGMERTHLYRKLRSLGIEITATADD